MSVSINGTSGLVFTDGSTQNTSPFTGGFGFRNRIINGDMQIDQRNVGAAVTYGSGTTIGNYYGYNIDRWWAQSYSTLAGNGAAFTVQQSSTAPTGFTKSLAVTVTSAQSTLQNDSLYRVQHIIEGYNCSDFGFGATGAVTVTLSFWVKSNLTGTFTGVLGNDVDYSYPFTYTISAANTWQKIAITISGATSGTWQKTNGKGILIAWCLGAHTSRLGTAGAWVSSANYQGASGQTNLMATVGNNFYITGVQLEEGSTYTNFDCRPYGIELALCQRYYEKYYDSTVAPAQGAANPGYMTTVTAFNSGDFNSAPIIFKQSRRIPPTITIFKPSFAGAGLDGKVQVYSGSGWFTATPGMQYGTEFWNVIGNIPGLAAGGSFLCAAGWTASAEI